MGAAAVIVPVALSIASATASVVSQQQQAEAQAEFQKETAKARNKAAQQQAEVARDKQAQEREAAAREVQRSNIASRRAESTAQVTAAESGVTGASVDSLLRSFEASRGRFQEAVDRRVKLGGIGVGQDLETLNRRTSLANKSSNAPIPQPDFIGAALNVGASSFSAIQRNESLKIRKQQSQALDRLSQGSP